MGYLAASPSQTVSFGIDSVSGMLQGEQYTFEIDMYIVNYSDDAGGCIARLDIANVDGTLMEDCFGKESYSLYQWYKHSKTVTYNSQKDSQISIHTFGGAVVIYDNIKITDATGKLVFSENFESRKYSLPDGFTYVNDYSSGKTDSDDKVLYINNDSAEQTYTTLGTAGLGVDGITTEYELSFDYMILKRALRTDFDF